MDREQRKHFRNARLAAIPDNPDERDYLFPATLAGAELPQEFNLIEYVGEIENQLSTGSCVANATCSALELMARKDGVNLDLSRLFVYWNIRAPYSHLKGQDAGAYLRDGFKYVNKLGVPDEKDWEFLASKVNAEPKPEVFSLALSKRAITYRRVDTARNNMKGALCEGLPVIIAMELGTNFYYLEGDLEDQKYNAVNKSNNRTIGHHAMNVVGYSDKLQGYIVENSWGESWGDQGLCLIPYDVFDANATDAWVCTQFEYNYSDDYKLEEPEESFFDKVKMWFRNVVRKIQGWF